MAVDFRDLGLRHVVSPVRLRRTARGVQSPADPEPTPPDDTPSPEPASPPVIDLTAATVTLPVIAADVEAVPSTSYWVRRRRAEAQASDQA